MEADNILFGSFELPSEEQVRKIKAGRKQRQKEKAADARADKVRRQRRNPLQHDQLKEMLKSDAAHPLAARRYGISPEDLERYRQSYDHLHRQSLHHAYRRCLHELYPPGTRAVLIGRWGTLIEYGSGAAFEIRWDDGEESSLPTTEFGLFLIDPDDEEELRKKDQP